MIDAIRILLAHVSAIALYGVPAIAGISLAILFVREYLKAVKP
jgi:hypothetical protein